MACSKLEARGHLIHKTGTPPKQISRECNPIPTQGADSAPNLQEKFPRGYISGSNYNWC